MTNVLQVNSDASFFGGPMAGRDAAAYSGGGAELARKHEKLERMASENVVSTTAHEAQGAILANKYAEG